MRGEWPARRCRLDDDVIVLDAQRQLFTLDKTKAAGVQISMRRLLPPNNSVGQKALK